MIKDLLKNAGFSDKEIEVYTALLKLGSSVASAIAKRADINRSTTYVILDALVKHGLVSVFERRGVKMYNAVSPDDLIKHLERKARQYAELARRAKELAPELKLLQKTGAKSELRPKVRLFEGQEGLRTVYGEMLSALEGIRGHAPKKGEFRISPAAGEEFNKAPQIAVYGKKIILISPEEKFAAVVESQELADKLEKILSSARKETKGQPFLKPAIEKRTAF